MPEFWVRPFEPADTAECANVFYSAVNTGAAEKYTAAQRAAWCGSVPDTDEFCKFLDRQNTFVAEGDGIIGFMSLDVDLLDMAYVLPAYRRQGVASALYAVVLNQAIQSGQARIHSKASLYAESLFTQFGWQVDREDNAIRGNEVLERFAMSLVLCP